MPTSITGTTHELHVIIGTGPLGQAVMQVLLSQGKRVRMVSRNAGRFPSEVEVRRADVSNLAQARTACEGATVVYHCAAPATGKWTRLFPALTSGILEGAAWNNARLVIADGLLAYGSVEGRITENLAHHPISQKGKVRAQLSAMVMEAHRLGKVKVAIGCAPDYFGPKAVNNVVYGERVFYPALAGKNARVFGYLNTPHSFICLGDFARGLIALGARDEAMGQIWHLPHAPALTQSELLTMIYESAGHKARIGEFPSIVVKGLSLFNPAMRDINESLYLWEHPFVVASEKFEKAFPDAVKVTPHREAIHAALEWFRKNPKRVD